MLISSKTFYENHSREIERYNHSILKSIHLVNIDSNYQLRSGEDTVLKIEFNNLEPLENLISKNEQFDFVSLTDLFELSDDIYLLLLKISKILKKDGKLLITSINPKWNKILSFFEFVKLKKQSQKRNYINPNKINNIARSAGLELISTNTRQILPFNALQIGRSFNKLLEFIFFYLNIGIKTYSLFRFVNIEPKSFTKSIIVPAKNEAGNLEELINRIPYFNSDYEIIIICGESKDDTVKVAKNIKLNNPNIDIKVLGQTGKGKANAVYEGLNESKYDLIAILDSDISVDPETLINFFKIIEDGHADFVNGTRLIYGKEKNSMQFLNIIGNLIFQSLISLVIKQKLTDSLCGTKVFKKSYLNFLYRWSEDLIIKDPFGDFDFLFSAAFSGQKILEYPVHYRSRKYGATQISRFKDGWKLLIYFINSLYKFNVSR